MLNGLGDLLAQCLKNRLHGLGELLLKPTEYLGGLSYLLLYPLLQTACRLGCLLGRLSDLLPGLLPDAACRLRRLSDLLPGLFSDTTYCLRRLSGLLPDLPPDAACRLGRLLGRLPGLLLNATRYGLQRICWLLALHSLPLLALITLPLLTLIALPLLALVALPLLALIALLVVRLSILLGHHGPHFHYSAAAISAVWPSKLLSCVGKEHNLHLINGSHAVRSCKHPLCQPKRFRCVALPIPLGTGET